MDYIPTRQIRHEEEAIDRLQELNLNRDGLIRVADIAVSEAANATPNHAANAAGTFAYHEGLRALRDEFLGEIWKRDNLNGIEGMIDEANKCRVAFSNVDLACDDMQHPKPRSPKGAGAERACSGNLFEALPEYAPKTSEEYATYYLMVDSNGGCELTRPVISGRTFSGYIERIYLRKGVDGTSGPMLPDEPAEVFDPQVVRK